MRERALFNHWARQRNKYIFNLEDGLKKGR